MKDNLIKTNTSKGFLGVVLLQINWGSTWALFSPSRGLKLEPGRCSPWAASSSLPETRCRPGLELQSSCLRLESRACSTRPGNNCYLNTFASCNLWIQWLIPFLQTCDFFLSFFFFSAAFWSFQFRSQHPHCGSQPSETAVLEDLMLSSDLCRHCVHVIYVHTG